MANLGNSIINGILRVNGIIKASALEGNLTGTATKATQDSDGNAINTTYLKKVGHQTISGTITFADGEGSGSKEGGEIHLAAKSTETTLAGTIIDNNNGQTRIFGIPSADGTSKVGAGTPLVIDPYAKTITGGYTITGNLSGNASSATKLATVRYINDTSFDGTKNIRLANSWNFNLGASADGAKYVIFARMGGSNTTGNQGATFIITDLGNYGGQTCGAWLVQISNRGSTPTMRVSTIRSADKDNPTFGYYKDTTNNYFYFGVLAPSYRSDSNITILRNNGVGFQKFSDSTTAPNGWTAVTSDTIAYTTYNVASATNTGITNTNPTSGGWYYPTWVSNTSGNLPHRVNDGYKYYVLEGTTSALGHSYVQIGNATASGTAGNKQGHLRIYSQSSGYTDLVNATSTSNYTITLPAANGTVSLNGHTHNYLPLSGGNMTGNINFLNGNNMGIYWKENGYGDKFKICPAFSGSNDDNLLKIQGAVGDAGTDPSLYDLVTISGKSGNVKIKGNVQASTFTGNLSGNASSATKATQDGNGSTISNTYLKLAGGTTTGDLNRKVNEIDASLSNNNISSDIYPTTFNILDKSNRIINRLECIPHSNGNIDSLWYVRNYRADGTLVEQKGIGMSINKSGTLTYSISDPSNFRDAINIKAMSASSYASSSSSLPNGSLVAVW